MIQSPRNGNYLDILELIAQHGSSLAQHLQDHANRVSGLTNYLSTTIMEELINIMGKQVLDEIISRVKLSKYYSISMDSTPDESHVDQLTLMLQFMEKDCPVEHFVTFMANKGLKAQDMFDTLMEFLEENDLHLSNCRGQSYDNASAIKFFDFIEKLFVFFTSSRHRHQILPEKLNAATSAALIVKRVSTTRWSCRANATKALKLDYQPIGSALEEISINAEEKACVRCEAEGLPDSHRFPMGILHGAWPGYTDLISIGIPNYIAARVPYPSLCLGGS